MPRRARLASSLAAAVLVLSACANAVGQGTPAPLASLGPGEGALRLLGVSGYAEDGSIDPRVDWVSAFEHRTGCRVNYTRVATVNAISAALKLRGAGYYDGVVAPPVVAGQLIGARMIAPLNVSLIDGYTTISPALRRQQTVTSHGQTYGIPYLWSSYLLGYRPRSVRPAPRNWTAVFDRRSAVRYAGKIMLPDTPLTMALAALYLKSARPSLSIGDPYELTSPQFAAVTSLLKDLRQRVTSYYSQDSDVIYGLASGSAVLGAILPRQVDILARAGRNVTGVDPAEGTTGSVSFWLMNARAQHPNCMYEWLAWSLTPRVQLQAAEWTGTAPVNPAACDGLGRQICGLGHVADEAYLGRVAFAHMPSRDCGDGSHDCTGWTRWKNTWTSIIRARPG